ncbi:hypothetical protein L5515_019222 [Caenorhabditis briggsae]|uniref:Uncharacterized protein n=1 Tax=Caenorhabditis briggsae TaxID=6238 RepID=A0AAE9FJZ0_CAEBR|nr:hypothetical protein L5515_019222 [Caenorhabditis briggsae]
MVDADKIAVFHEGCVAEWESHKEEFRNINVSKNEEPDQAANEELKKKVVIWHQKCEPYSLNLEEELVLGDYFFNPYGKIEVPQKVEKPVNSRSLYQNQRSQRQGYGEEEKI